MNISPVSFGRAIRINTQDKAVAQRIAEVANMTNYEITKPSTSEGRAMQRFIENIFNDTHLANGKARVVSGTSGDYYIFSGKEAAKAHEIVEETKQQIIEENKFVESLPDRYCRKRQRGEYYVKHQQLFADRNRKILNLVEDGRKGAKTIIDVDSTTFKNDDNSETTIIDRLTYKYSQDDAVDVRIFERHSF